MLVVVGAADYLTGHEILFSTFYLVPVTMAAWLVGAAFAVTISVLSVGAWLIGDFAAGAVYSHAYVPAWNAAIILAFYLVVVTLINRLRLMQRSLEERVRTRTIALTEEIAERERLEREILEVGSASAAASVAISTTVSDSCSPAPRSPARCCTSDSTREALTRPSMPHAWCPWSRRPSS